MRSLMVLMSVVLAEPSTEPMGFQAWLKFYAAAAGEYAMEVQDGTGRYRRLELQPTPILQYTNPERGFQQHGAFYVWTLDGRPQCIGSIWSNIPGDDPQLRWVAHELHSLAAGPLKSAHPDRTAKRGPVPQWVTQKPGVVWQEVPDAPAPAATPSLRLVQMRRIAEQYTAQISNVANEKEGDLRLLPKPLYRYPADVKDAVDGGLFAFVQGTDPEVLLLLEAISTPNGSQWRIAFARFTHTTATVEREGRVVWDCDKAEPYVGHNPYFLFWKIHPAGLETP